MYVLYVYITICRGPGQPKQVFISCSRARQLTLVQFGSLSHSCHVCVYIIYVLPFSWYDIKASACAAPVYTLSVYKRMYVFSALFSNQCIQHPYYYHQKCLLIYKTNTRARIHKYEIHAYHKRASLFLTSKVAASSQRTHTIRFIHQRAYNARTHRDRERDTPWCVLRVLFTFHFSVEIYCTVKLLYTVTWMRLVPRQYTRILEMCLRITQQYIRTQRTHTCVCIQCTAFSQRERI